MTPSVTPTATPAATATATPPLTRTPTATPTPAQLPPTPAPFTARTAELAALDALLGDPRQSHPAPPTVITGAAGVGKSALAVRWAHLRHSWFPDGQLYAELGPRDADGRAPSPDDILVSFLRSLGADPDRVPASDHAALFRSLLDGRRVLIVADGAVSAEQVRPLVPGGAAARVVVTSRDELRGLAAVDGARRLTVARLTATESQGLLRTLIGGERVKAEPGAAAALVNRCAGLPLALRIAAARLAGPGFPRVADLVEELGDPPRLDALCFPEDAAASLRAVFAESLAALPRAAAALFRRLSQLPAYRCFTAADAAVLLDVPPRQAEPLLDRLATVHLVERQPPGRFAMHCLLRSYAAELADAAG